LFQPCVASEFRPVRHRLAVIAVRVICDAVDSGEEAVSRLAIFVISLGVLFSTVSERSPAVRLYRTLSVDTPLNHIAVIGDSYTSGTNEGGEGSKAWTARAWQTLAQKGLRVDADVASEGGAGYEVRGNHGSVFEDLTVRAVRPEDGLVVFFGSRNDEGVDAQRLAEMAHETFDLARRTTPSARLLVIGPPWPTADVPGWVLQIRDVLDAQARAEGAAFVDPIVERWFVGRPDLIGADGVHPTDAGHAYLAAKIAPLIAAQLSRRA
jgi:GDSL-like Lipase/Acylhydrolase family